MPCLSDLDCSGECLFLEAWLSFLCAYVRPAARYRFSAAAFDYGQGGSVNSVGGIGGMCCMGVIGGVGRCG